MATILSTFTEVLLADTRTRSGTVLLPPLSQIPYRMLTFKDVYGTFSNSTLTLSTQAGNTFEDSTTSIVLSNAYSFFNLYAASTKWLLLDGTQTLVQSISTLNVNSLNIGSGVGWLQLGPIQTVALSTTQVNVQNLYANCNYFGNISSQTALYFYGLQGAYNNTVIAEQSTGTGRQELLFFKGSSPADQVRFQTTGSIVFEPGAPGRLWPTYGQLSTPTMILNSSLNVGIRVSSPQATLDVGGTGRFQTASTLALFLSSVNGAALITSANLAGFISTANLIGLVSTPNLSGLLSTGSVLNYVSTANLSGLVSTPNLSGLLSTGSVLNYVSTANLSGLVSTPNLLNLVSTVFYQSTLVSTVIGLSNVAVTEIIAGTNITISPTPGIGAVTINATASGIIDTEIASTLKYSDAFSTIAIGYNAGQTIQGSNAIAIGMNAGLTGQSNDSIAIGYQSGGVLQEAFTVAIGYNAGNSSQSNSAIAIGNAAGMSNQDVGCIAIGCNAAIIGQGSHSIAIGTTAGQSNQYGSGIAIGLGAGFYSQQSWGIGIGQYSGYSNQSNGSIGLGHGTGYQDQKEYAIALGYNAGYSQQSQFAVAIGFNAGSNTQGSNAIAIGYQAGLNTQGTNSIAIGCLADTPTTSTILLNATGTTITTADYGFYVAPMRYIEGSQTNTLGYISSTNEIGYINNAAPSNWSLYPAISSIELYAPNPRIINPIPDAQCVLQSQNLYIQDEFNTPGSIHIRYAVFATSTSSEGYVIANLKDITGNISSLGIVREDNGLETGSFYISSLYLGNYGGTIAGELTTDDTATNIYWKGTQLNGGGGGGITTANLVSTVEGLGEAGYLSSISIPDYISSINVSTANLEVSTLSLIDVFAISPEPNYFFNFAGLTVSKTVNGFASANYSDFTSKFFGKDYSLLKGSLFGTPDFSYSMTAGDNLTGTISTPTFVDGNSGLVHTLYLSSLYFGDTGGANVGELTTDPTVTNIYWKGTQLTVGGVTTSDLVSTTTGLQTNFIGKQAYFSTIYTSTISTINLYAATLNMSVVFV